MPQSHGGSDYGSNLITACQACNSITSRMKFSKGLTKKEIIKRKKDRVQDRLVDYLDFWNKYVDAKL